MFANLLRKKQGHLHMLLERYLSPEQLEKLSEDDVSSKLHGQNAMVAMMSTDLDGSQANLCELIKDPERIVETIKCYLLHTTEPISASGGVVVRFVGSSIFAAWGSPLASPFPDVDAPLKAARAAWQILAAKSLIVDGNQLTTRIGLHFGKVVAGCIGSDYRIDYTLFGNAVDYTSLIRKLNKLFGTYILMSGAIHQMIGREFHARRVGCFALTGAIGDSQIYELLGPACQESEPQWVTHYHKALSAMEANDPVAASALFELADAQRVRGDGPSRYFLDLLRNRGPVLGGIVHLKEK